MVRTMCWIIALCTFCVILFFQCAASGAFDRNEKVTWDFSGPLTTVPSSNSPFIFVDPPNPDVPLPKSYAEARERSLHTGLPLVVWVGEAVCPGCVQRTKIQYVHWVTQSFPDTPKDALVVGMPENNELIRVATMTQWPEGHLTTIAKALDLWKAHRKVTDQRSAAYRGGVTPYQAPYSGYPGGYSGYSGRSYTPAFRSYGRGRAACST